MEVRPGFKHTEVGVIPEDWAVTHLRSIAAYRNGKAHEGLISDLGQYVVVNSKFISTNGDIRKHSNVRFSPAAKGEVLMVMSDVPNGRAIAKCFFADRDDVYTVNQRICALRPLDVNGRLLFYTLNRNPFYLAFDDGVKQTNLRKADVLSCPLAIPPTKAEQEAIAMALSDVDDLLSGLDRLIAKKRDLKQAAMQQLLTGQIRLPGFRGKWEVKRLGAVVDTDPENLGSGTKPDFAFNYIALEDVDRGFLRSYSEQRFATAPSRARRKLRPDDVLVSTVRPNLRSHLLFRAERGNWVCSTGFCVVRCRQGVVHPGYIFFHLFANCVSHQIDALLTGSNYPAINSGDVRSLEIPLPNYAEQTDIATVLFDMDAELSALEARREKTRDLKQAMMQELLTGKTRLVPTGAAHA
jgi:type I restriction enzyme S subunit